MSSYLSFTSGSSSRIDVMSDGSSHFNVQDFEINAKIRIPTLQNYVVIWSYDYTSLVKPYYAQHVRVANNGTVFFGFNIGGTYQNCQTSINAITAGTWHDIKVTFTSGSQKIYVDGVEKGSTTYSGSITYYAQEVWIGNWTGASSSLYPFDLESLSFKNISTLLLEYDLNEGGGTTATDTSGNGIDGTIYNATWLPYTTDYEWIKVADTLSSQQLYNMIEYNNKIYACTSGGKLFEWNGTNAWVEVAPILNSMQPIWALEVHNDGSGDALYGCTGIQNNASAGRLYKWNDSNAWVQVAPALNSVDRIFCLEVFNSKLYGGTDIPGLLQNDSGRLFEYNDSNAWVQVAPSLSSKPAYQCFSLEIHNSKLYGGMGGQADSGSIYEWNGTDAWIVLKEATTSETFLYPINFNGKLYASTRTGTGKLYEVNTSTGALTEVAPQLLSQISCIPATASSDKIFAGTQLNAYLYEWNGTDAWLIRSNQYESETELRNSILYSQDNNIYGISNPSGYLLVSAGFALVQTDAVTSVTGTGATLNGEVINDGGETITERGFVYNTTGSPNITDDTKVTVSGTTGVMDYDLTGLDAETTYYYRAFATNTNGTSYGAEVSFTTSAGEEVLDFQIEINGTDYTNKADTKMVRWTNYENFSNTADALFIDDTNFVKMGMELIIRRKSDSKIVFGGLIQEPKKILLSPDFLAVKVHAESYKQILGRRTFELNVQNQLAGTTIQGIFDDYLKVGGTYTDEELTLGNIDNGITIESYVKRAQSGLKLFNDLADASDYKWWITNEKEFYFQANPTYTDNTTTKKLTPNKSDSAYINCIDLPDFNEDSSKFRTRQNVIGKKIDGVFVFGSYTDSTAETEMASRYGSGVFGSVMVNDNISSTAEADALAQSEVETYVNPSKIRFKTTDFIEPLELIKVDISILGISDETYKVTKVSYAFDNDVRIVCDVTCEKYQLANKPKRTWTDEFNEMMKENAKQGDEDDYSYNDNAGIVNLAPAVPYLNTITHILDKDRALHCHYSIVGVSTGAGTVTVTFDINTVIQKTFTFDVVAGNFSKTLAYPIRGIATSGSATVDASTTSTVAIAIAINDLNFWVHNK